MWVGKPSVHSGWLFSMFWLKIDHMYGMLFLLENIVFWDTNVGGGICIRKQKNLKSVENFFGLL